MPPFGPARRATTSTKLLLFRPRTLVFSRSASQQHAPQSVAKLLEWTPEGEARHVVVNGFVRSVRSMKSSCFVALGDGSSMAPLQAVLPADQADGLAVGAAVRLTGSWVPSPGSGQSHELRVDAAEVLGPSDAKTFPIQKKYQTPDFLRTLPHLRTRTPLNSALLRFRSQVITLLNQFFDTRGFIQTHPPLITSSDCEGAGEVFTLSPASQAPSPSRGHEALDSFFGSPKYLTVSTQLHLEAMAQSVGNVWTLSPTFRAERSDTSRHLSEFYMLEAEMCFANELGDVMDVVEDMLRSLSTGLHQTRVAQELFQRSNHMGTDLAPAAEVDRRWRGMMMEETWPRLTYSQAIDLLMTDRHKFVHAPVWGGGLQSEHERHLADVVGRGKPVFVTHYPRDIKAFYMRPTPRSPDGYGKANVSDGESRSGGTEGGYARQETVECFDLLVPELCEIAGGSMREHRLPQLLESMRRCGPATGSPMADAENDASETATAPVRRGNLDWYVDLRRWGCPPHGGFGLGLDRLLCYLSGVQTVRDTAAFPRWHGRCDC